MIFRLILLFFFANLLPLSAKSSVWVTKNNWSNEWETRYSNWVKTDWTQDVFKRSPLNDLETDCADATYAMRALFSFKNGLPFQVTTYKKNILSSSSTEFDQIKDETERFRTFLKKVFTESDTNSLAADTYPIAIDRNSLRPGSVYLATGEHSYQIIDILPQGVPVLLSSTTPAQNRVLFKTISFPFYRPQSTKFTDGYRAFRWPNEMGLEVKKIKRANFDQYNIKGNVLEFAEIAKTLLALRKETLAEQIDRSLLNICYFARERAYLVVNAYIVRTNQPNLCLKGPLFDIHSTVIRDRRLNDYFLFLRNMRTNPEWATLDQIHKLKLLSVFVSDVSESLLPNSNLSVSKSVCTVQIGVPQVTELSLYQIWNAKLSSDPNVSILARWGLEAPISQCLK